MTALWIEHAGARWRVAVEHAIDLSIPLDFAGPQPSFFHAPPAHSTPLEMGSFVGDVARGGSCNCATVTLTPHCNGTHTECVGHIVDEAITVATVAPLTPLPCRLVTVAPRPLARSADAYAAPSQPADLVIDSELCEALLDRRDLDGCAALVIRSQPNPLEKRTRDWSAMVPPYFTAAAIEAIAAAGIEHLVVDLPSLDRADDGGRLQAHRAWWGLPPGSKNLAAARRSACTVTELAYVPDTAPDGRYLLDLHVPAFLADAAPSRPVLLPLFAVA